MKNKKVLPLLLGPALAVVAVLGKGPFALLYVGAIAATYLGVLVYKQQRTVFNLPLLTGLGSAFLGSALLSGAWYFAAYLQGGESFLWVHFLQENVGRFATQLRQSR